MRCFSVISSFVFFVVVLLAIFRSFVFFVKHTFRSTLAAYHSGWRIWLIFGLCMSVCRLGLPVPDFGSGVCVVVDYAYAPKSGHCLMAWS